MAKRKDPAAVALGRKGGQARVAKGFAMMDPARLAELRARGAAARRKQGEGKINFPKKRK